MLLILFICFLLAFFFLSFSLIRFVIEFEHSKYPILLLSVAKRIHGQYFRVVFHFRCPIENELNEIPTAIIDSLKTIEFSNSLVYMNTIIQLTLPTSQLDIFDFRKMKRYEKKNNQNWYKIVFILQRKKSCFSPFARWVFWFACYWYRIENFQR